MGWKDGKRAYAVKSVTGTPKVVLVALAHRTDDDTHQTIVGQDTIADMIGQSVKTVQRALAVLESAGLIIRQTRFRKDGPRTSDETTLVLDQESDSPLVPPDKLTTSQIDQESDSPEPPDNLSATTRQIVPAYKEDQSEDHSEGQSVTPIPPTLVIVESVDESFERAWRHWPRKADKKTARKRFGPAIKRRGGLDDLEQDIIRFGDAYRERDGGAPDFVPGLAVWLGNDRWLDDLPGPRSSGRQTPTQKAIAIREAGEAYQRRRDGFASITTLNPPKGLTP